MLVICNEPTGVCEIVTHMHVITKELKIWPWELLNVDNINLVAESE